MLPLLGVESPEYPLQIMGYVNKDLLLSVDIDNSALPFDIESATAGLNTSDSTVRGLRIGSYSMRANSVFTLTISHTKLVCKNPSEGAVKPTEADYRLDVYCTDTTFKSCTNQPTDYITNTSIVIRSADVTRMGEDPSFVYVVSDLSMYVSMTDTAEDLAQLEPGNYSSTILFELVAGE